LLSQIENWADGRPGRRRLTLAVLFLTATVLLAVGIGEHTGVTGKDEYYLSLRTAMCMVEQDQWLVPCLDGAPRLKKPPMLYWLTRAGHEAFGVSLGGARLVAVTLAALLVLGTALIALELGAGLSRGLLAGLISASFLGLSVNGRMLELDIPVAAFSTLAFLFLLRWYKRGQPAAPALAALFLAAGFLTKGPVAFVVCGGGGLALLALDPRTRTFLARHWRSALGAVLLFTLLALPWFLYVNQLYPERSADELTRELAARRFFRLSPVPLYGILMLILPWSLVALVRLGTIYRLTGEQRRQALMLALWLALTLLPFFFIKTFERYLYGSLVPMALLLAQPGWSWSTGPRWAARLGLLLTLLITLPVFALALWLGGPAPTLALGIPVLGWFILQWWRAENSGTMALTALLLWSCTLGLAYPRLGINQVPPHIVERVGEQPAVFYHGPQPGLLPALLGRSLHHVNDDWRLPEPLRESCTPFLLFAQEEESTRALQGLERLGLAATELERFGVFSSRVSWQHLARRGISRDEALTALKNRDLDAIKPRVVLYRVSDPQCPGT
jgi:4-amino-4-deoxy-L-arabinose transferase-like glycosyltransferase